MSAGLRSLDPLPTDLASDEANIAEAFYRPSLRLSNHYARISGYFSSLVYLIVWPELKQFVKDNSGRMQLVCSPRLSSEDAEKIRFGYRARNDEELAVQLRNELEDLLASRKLREPTQLLACLISSEIVQVKLAEVDESAPASLRRMIHDKVGVFSDASGDHIGFRGSLNETFLGLSPDLGHIESIDVFPSWVGGRDEERVNSAISRFGRIWEGHSKEVGIRLYQLPPEIRRDLVDIGEEVELDDALQRLARGGSEYGRKSGPIIVLWDHQKKALERWEEEGFRGIFAHATGSGKTVSAVFAIERVLQDDICTVVVVPSEEIQTQWVEEIRDILGIRSIRCGGGHHSWKEERLVRAAVNSDEPEVVVAILDTARTPAFLNQLRPGVEDTLVIVDEVHRIGADNASRVMAETSPAYRLGLSATPRRSGDPAGTEKIMDYFGGIVHRYSLADAIADGHLARYSYRIETVHLTHSEQEAWDRWTSRIGQLRAQSEDEADSKELEEKLRRALQERARIKKGAARKAGRAATILTEGYEPGDRWLVYCDNRDQVAEVEERVEGEGLPLRRFHSKMAGDRQQTLEWLEGRGGIVLSMKCLDEGVDIPRANKGLIVASSTNPREFIQRRGRLLRKGGDHAVADLIDLIVLPADKSSNSRSRSLLGPELARALMFARDSMSPSTESELEALWEEYGLPLEELDSIAQEGFEHDAEERAEEVV